MYCCQTDKTYQDVIHLVFGDFGGEVDMYFDTLVRVLGLDRFE